jgi:hypothetical protein
MFGSWDHHKEHKGTKTLCVFFVPFVFFVVSSALGHCMMMLKFTSSK